MAKRKEITIRSSAAEYLTFISAVGDQPESVELRYQDENIWLTQRLMAELYGVDVPTINYHIQQIYKDNELTEEATIRNFLIVQTEGVRQVTREVKHYSLQMIIAVGFKVNNERAVQFRKWANAIVKDYTIQGWVMDSGGITEETTVMGVPCITLRDNTERPETCTIGTNELIGTNPDAVAPALKKLFAGEWKKGAIPPLWDGHAAERIISVLADL